MAEEENVSNIFKILPFKIFYLCSFSSNDNFEIYRKTSTTKKWNQFMWITKSRSYLVNFNNHFYKYNQKFNLNSYLNALIQTLLFTPEFRGMCIIILKQTKIFFFCLEPLFRLTPKDLNLPANYTDQNAALSSGKVNLIIFHSIW